MADLAESEREGYCFGAKLVRGAYLSLERQRALEMGYDCPILPSREATTRNFDACVNLLLRKIKDDSRFVCVSLFIFPELTGLTPIRFCLTPGHR